MSESLIYELKLELNDANAKLDKLSKKSKTAGEKSGRAFGDGFKRIAGAIIGTLSFAKIIEESNKSIDLFLKMQKSEVLLKKTSEQAGVSLDEVASSIDRINAATGGIVTKDVLSAAFGDLFRGGVTDVQEAEKTITRMIDIAAGGKSEFVSMSEAVAQLTEQFRSERAALGETAGLTEEYISEILPRGLELLQKEGELRGKGVDDLNKEERARAKMAGLMEMTSNRQGTFNDFLGEGLLAQDQFNASFRDFRIEVGRALQPLQAIIFDFFTPYLQKLTDIVRENPELVQQVTGLALAASAGATAFMLFGDEIGFLFSIFAKGITALIPAAGGLAISLGPVLLIIGAITAAILLGIAIWQNWEQVVADFEPVLERGKEVFDKFKATLINLGNYAQEKFEPVLQRITDEILPLLAPLVMDAIDAFDAMLPAIELVGKFLIDVLVFAVNAAIPAIEGLIGMVRGMFTIIEGIFTGDMEKVADGFIQIFEGIQTGIGGVFKEIMNVIIDQLNKGIDKVNDFIDDIPSKAFKLVGVDKDDFDIPTIPRLALGADFEVPPGFGGDRFPFQANLNSGERVQITPANEVNNTTTMNSNNSIQYTNFGDDQPDFVNPLLFAV